MNTSRMKMKKQRQNFGSAAARRGLAIEAVACTKSEDINETIRSSYQKTIKHLTRCAKQNEVDGNAGDCCALAVAGEQRRVIKLLKTSLRPVAKEQQ